MKNSFKLKKTIKIIKSYRTFTGSTMLAQFLARPSVQRFLGIPLNEDRLPPEEWEINQPRGLRGLWERPQIERRRPAESSRDAALFGSAIAGLNAYLATIPEYRLSTIFTTIGLWAIGGNTEVISRREKDHIKCLAIAILGSALAVTASSYCENYPWGPSTVSAAFGALVGDALTFNAQPQDVLTTIGASFAASGIFHAAYSTYSHFKV